MPAYEPNEMSRRRAMVHMVLHEVMRRHGIPSDWIVGHTLIVPRPNERQHLMVQFVVQRGDDELVGMVQDLQEAFMRELLRHDVRARDWVTGVCWEFRGKRDEHWATMPPPAFWLEPLAA